MSQSILIQSSLKFSARILKKNGYNLYAEESLFIDDDDPGKNYAKSSRKCQKIIIRI